MRYRWIDCSNEEFSTNERHEVVLVIRSAQSSIVGVPFRRFSKSCERKFEKRYFLVVEKSFLT